MSPVSTGITLKLPLGESIRKVTQMSPMTLAKEVKMSAKTISEKYTGCLRDENMQRWNDLGTGMNMCSFEKRSHVRKKEHTLLFLEDIEWRE